MGRAWSGKTVPVYVRGGLARGRCEPRWTQLSLKQHSAVSRSAQVLPEVELNSAFFQDGNNDGMKQNFVTPGLVMGRFHFLWEESVAPWAVDQIATTHFHASNRNAILSIRFPF